MRVVFTVFLIFSFSLSTNANGEKSFAEHVLLVNTTNEYPTELWTLRSGWSGPQSLTIFDVAKQIVSLKDRLMGITSDLNSEKKTIVKKRFEHMLDVAEKAIVMEKDHWQAEYVDDLTKHMIGLRKKGISALLPKQLSRDNCEDDYFKLQKYICSEDGTFFGHILSLCMFDQEGDGCPNSVYKVVASYMQELGLSHLPISFWAGSQRQSSWSRMAVAVKYAFASLRTLPLESYYWQKLSLEDVRNVYYEVVQDGDASWCTWETEKGCFNTETWFPNAKGANENLFIRSLAFWHALTQEILHNIQFLHNDQKTQTVCLIRVEGMNALASNGIEFFGKNLTMKRAVYDSMSIYEIFYQFPRNKALIAQRVPYHRILSSYLTHSAWIGEDEFIALAGPDLPFNYVANTNNKPKNLKELALSPGGLCEYEPSFLSQFWNRFW